jgi:hypothetical protein
LGQQVVGFEKALDPVLLDTLGIELEQGGRPVGAVLFAILLEVRRLLSHVQSRGYEVLLDEAGHALLRIDLGIQPSTAASHRRGTEIQQHGLLPRVGIAEDPIDIMPPRDFHRPSSCQPVPDALAGRFRNVLTRALLRASAAAVCAVTAFRPHPA